MSRIESFIDSGRTVFSRLTGEHFLRTTAIDLAVSSKKFRRSRTTLPITLLAATGMISLVISGCAQPVRANPTTPESATPIPVQPTITAHIAPDLTPAQERAEFTALAQRGGDPADFSHYVNPQDPEMRGLILTIGLRKQLAACDFRNFRVVTEAEQDTVRYGRPAKVEVVDVGLDKNGQPCAVQTTELTTRHSSQVAYTMDLYPDGEYYLVDVPALVVP